MDKLLRTVRNETVKELTLESADGWSDIMPRTTGSAMNLSAVNQCVEVRSNSLAKLPIFVMDGKTKERHTAHPLMHLLNVRPNEAMSAFTYHKLLESDKLFEGNAYAWINRHPVTRQPEELIRLDPRCVTPKVETNGVIHYLYTDVKRGKVYDLPSLDVLHYKEFSRDGIHGISVLSRAAEAIRTAQAAQAYEQDFYRNGSRPSGVLVTDADLDEPKRAAVRGEWERVHSGAGNGFRTAVLDVGLKYTPIGATNKDAQFVESKSISVEDIARFFSVPLYKLGAGKQSYSSNEQNAIEYVVSCLHPCVTGYEQEDSYKLLSLREQETGLEVRRNMMAELRGDFASRSNWYKSMLDEGPFCVNDVLALEDMPNVPGGDIHKISLNYVPLDLFRELSIKRNSGGTNQ